MKVLHVMPDLDPRAGGPVTAGIGVARALAAAGVSVKVAATDHGLAAPPEGVPGLHLFRCRLCAWRFAPALARWLGRETPWADLVHVHTLWRHSTRAAARASARAGVPYVLRPAGMLEEWSMSQARFKKRVYSALGGDRTLRGARALHWTSEEERARSKPYAGQLESFVVPLGVDVPAREEAPAPAALARRFPALAGRRVLLFLGRVHPKKQPEIAIRALARIAGTSPDAVLVIAGPGEPAYLQSLRALAADLGVGSAVHFPGVLQGAAIAEAFAAAACLVLPSRQENFAVAVAEAMAAGCPVLVSPEVALAGVITATRAGWVAPATPEAFAAALRAALGDEQERLAAGARARQAVLDRFTWPAVARQLIGAYERLLA